jgi:AmmeMemoRadiSam system protein A
MSDYSESEKKILLEVADEAIKFGLEHGKCLELNVSNYPEKLQQKRASFVTLEIAGELRGCIGTLNARQPLVLDVAQNAYSAAFCDPRFCPLTAEEFPLLTKHISVLSIPTPMQFTSEEDLIAQLRPGVDGLILREGGCCGTFLPSVWEPLPEPRQFLQHLKGKAGLPPDYWSDTIRVERYTAEVIE